MGYLLARLSGETVCLQESGVWGCQSGPLHYEGALVAAAEVWSGGNVTASGSWMLREETCLNMTKLLPLAFWHPF